MKNPQQNLIDEISALTNAQLAAREIWEVMKLALPRGYADRIGSNLVIGGKPLSGNAIRSWSNDPNVDDGMMADPWGRTSPADLLERYLFSGLYPCFPEGVALILKWLHLRFAQYEAIQGRPEMLNALEVNDKACALAEEIIKVTRGKKTNNSSQFKDWDVEVLYGGETKTLSIRAPDKKTTLAVAELRLKQRPKAPSHVIG